MAGPSYGTGQKHAKRDDVSFLEGRVFRATGPSQQHWDRPQTRLAGSRSEAQPPGARMAVREKTVTRCASRVKRRATSCATSSSRFSCATSGLDFSGGGSSYFRQADRLQRGEAARTICGRFGNAIGSPMGWQGPPSTLFGGCRLVFQILVVPGEDAVKTIEEMFFFAETVRLAGGRPARFRRRSASGRDTVPGSGPAGP
jgi:hypothetical protein